MLIKDQALWKPELEAYESADQEEGPLCPTRAIVFANLRVTRRYRLAFLCYLHQRH